jgi:hypothetical protein
MERRIETVKEIKNVKICTLIIKYYTFASIKVVKLQALMTVLPSETVEKKVILTKDNTPSRLTSVAHLGGFLFLECIEI